jgi:hypothetical protein
MFRTWKDMTRDLGEKRRAEWQERRGVRVERIDDDGFGHPAYQLVGREGPLHVGLFVGPRFAESWARSHRLTVVDDGRLAG